VKKQEKRDTSKDEYNAMKYSNEFAWFRRPEWRCSESSIKRDFQREATEALKSTEVRASAGIYT